jgi:hypothetical protein
MANFVAGTALTASDLNAAFNQTTINTQTGTSYQLLLTDAGGTITLNNASPGTVTIPLQADVAFPIGSVVGLVNIGAGLVSVNGAVGVTVSPAVRNMIQGDGATIIKLGTNSWQFVKGGGGVPKAIVSSSTASSTASTTVDGVAATVYRFTGTGSITFSVAGFVDVLCVGPGGVGSYGGGGAGGFVQQNDIYVPATSHIVYVGAGMGYNLIQGNFESSYFNGVVATGGGSAAQYYDRQPSGGACGGGSGPFASGSYGAGARYQGTISVSSGVTRGGNGAGVNGGGGGGAAGDGSGGSGGTGATTSFFGSSETFSRGGGGASMTANTGNGGNPGSSGNSGLVMVRVRVA